MENKKFLTGVTIRDLCEADADKCKGLGFEFMLDNGYKVLEVGDMYCIISKSDYEGFGKEQLCNVVYMEHSELLEEDFLKVDFAYIANDPEFNKPLELQVSFVKELYGTNEALFKGDNGKYYIRQDNAREECAVWLSAFKHKGEWTDNAPIRPNVTFVMGDEREKVSYSNWAGPIVTSEDYNKAFANSLDAILASAKEKVTASKDLEARNLELDTRDSIGQ